MTSLLRSDKGFHAWKDLLYHFEVAGSTKPLIDIHVSDRVSLLLSEPTPLDEKLMLAKMLSPLGNSAYSTVCEFLSWDDEKQVGLATVQGHLQRWDLAKIEKFWLLHARATWEDFVTFRYVIDEGASLIPLACPDQTPGNVRVLELFGGFYGGWHRACRLLMHMGPVTCTTVAIENDLQACMHYATSHGVPLLDGGNPIPANALIALDKSCIIHSDVTSTNWLEAVGMWRPNFLCISAPCPPWSGASKAPGMGSPNGVLLLEALLLGRFIMPDFITLENVIGITRHEHFTMIMRTISHVGYKILWAGAVEMTGVAPVRRPRWLALLVRITPDHQEHRMEFLPILGKFCPLLYQSVLYGQVVDDTRLKIDEKTRQILSLPKHSPEAKKQKLSPSQIFASRCETGWDVLPCFLASYGSQHAIVENTDDQKCLAHLAKIGAAPARYWHPAEVFMHHAPFGDCLLPFNMHDAWKAIGNQITVAHAAFLLHNCLKMCKQVEWNVELHEVISYLLQKRTCTSNGHLQTTSVGTWITTNDTDRPLLTDHEIQEIQHFMTTHGLSFLTPGHMWSTDGEVSFPPEFSHQAPQRQPKAEDNNAVSLITATQHDDDRNSQDVVSPTLPMPVYVPVKLVLSNGSLSAWAKSDVEPTAMTQLWQGQVECQVMQEPDTAQEGVITMKPTTHNVHACTQTILPCWSEGQLTVVTLDPQRPVAAQIQENMPTAQIFDVFGAVDADRTPATVYNCQDFQLRHMTGEVDVTHTLAAFQSSTVTYGYDQDTDTWFIQIVAEPTPAATLATFFRNCMHPDDLIRYGRQVTIDTNPGITKVNFSPCGDKIPIPPATLALGLAVCATRSILDRMPITSPKQLRIKWLGRHLWKGTVDKDINHDILAMIAQVALSPWTNFAQQRLVSLGRQICGHVFEDDGTGSDILKTVHFIQEMVGGGPPVTAKGQQRLQVRNSIAASLLEKGIALEWITAHLDKMLDTVGVKVAIPVASQPPGAMRDSRIAQLFQDAKITMPAANTKTATQPQTLKIKQRKKSFVQPSATDSRVLSEYLQNEDGTPVNQIYELKGKTTGIFLADESTARPWLVESAVLSADELGLLVIGKCDIDTTLRKQEVLVPCLDPMQQQVLVHAVLYQLGTKSIKIKDWATTALSAAPSKVASITLWEQDWTATEWQQALTKTQSFIRDVLRMEGLEGALESTWGRSLRKGRQVATVHNASSIQLHASIDPKQHAAFLAASGFNRLWIVPKREGQEPPAGILSWNSNPVLPTLLPAKNVAYEQPIVAGPRFKKETQQSGDAVSIGSSSDPWQAWMQHTGRLPAQAPPPSQTRSVQGPMEEKMTAQDQRIRNLEDKMTDMIHQQESQAKNLLEVREQTAGVEQRLGNQLTQAVTALKADLSQSFKTAMQQQSQGFDQSLRDIKQLLLQSKRKTAEAGEDDMES
eukprot:Skav205420  [mRNA]  locus=scaffold582:213902:218554:- [translate_table: standard]